jgi:hypothetical protein
MQRARNAGSGRPERPRVQRVVSSGCVRERMSMSFARLIAPSMAVLAAGAALAQQPSPAPAPAPPAAACPPGVDGDPPTIGGGGRSSESLSDKLAESKGIVCPPAGIDPEMQITPPAGGVIKVIPPPGTPGGDQSVQPK